MAALVQSVTEDVILGRTTIDFGPMPKFTLDSLMELYRATRNRRTWTNPALRQNGTLPSAGFNQAATVARENTTALPSQAAVISAIAPGTAGAATRIQQDATNSRLVIEELTSAGVPATGEARVVVDLADLTNGDDNQVELREKAGGFVLCSSDFNPGGVEMFALTTLKTTVSANAPADYFYAKRFDGTSVSGSEIAIAKPPRLRLSIASEVIDSETITYTDRTGDQNTRTASDSEGSEAQVIFPRYVACGANPSQGTLTPSHPSIIFAAMVGATGVVDDRNGNAPVTWIEVLPARVWARRFVA
jgi:hypothetical protein